VDVSRPNAARMYDYMLGGSSNFAVDRDAAEAMMAAAGSTPWPAKTNRSFLRRAVQFMSENGIDQFLDLGSGIPTAGNVHEIAQAKNPDARVVYVDNEPVAVHYARQLLTGNKNAVMIEADLQDADSVLTNPETTRLLDLSRPVGLLMVAIFHFIPDTAEPGAIVDRYCAAMAGGGYLAMSHFTDDNDTENAHRGAAAYQQTSTPVVARSRAEFAALFQGFPFVEPGIVYTPEWRPDSHDKRWTSASDSRILAGVARLSA
jgi:hypothetical protein